MSVRRFLFRSRWDDERARELEAHLAIETDEHIARGMTPDDARAAARRKLGNMTLVREEIYRMNTIRLLDTLWQDLKYGVRTLRLNPGFALVATLSLALGIGANAAIFELIDAVRLRTLPVANPQDIALVRVKNIEGARGTFSGWYPALTNPIWERLRDAEHPQLDPFAWTPAVFDLAESGRARLTAGGVWASGSYFSALGVRPALGRLFERADDRRGCPPTAVVSHAFWHRALGGDPASVGRTLSINRHRVEILGVTEPGFFGLEVGRSFDIAVPICAESSLEADVLDSGTIWWLTVMARLAPGASIDRASTQLSALSPGIFERVPLNYPPESVATYKSFTLVAEPADHGVSTLREQYADSLWMLLGIAGVVLLIASANLANLLMARASGRRREIAVRLAIGASRGRVVRQLLAESALLAALGASLGAAVAGTLGQTLLRFLGDDASPVVLSLDLNWRVFGFVAAASALCAALFGLGPAVRSTRITAGESLRAGGRGLTVDRQRFLLRRVLVACQLALSLALVVCAFQFVATFHALAALGPGFPEEGMVETSIDFRSLGIPPERRAAFRVDLLDRIRATPGVAHAADTNLLPLSGASWSNAVWLDGMQRDPGRVSKFNMVGGDYFSTVGVPVLAGRDFDDRRDQPTSTKVAIVNETFARQFLRSGNPVGQGFWVERRPSEPQARYEVIGLVKDTRYAALRGGFPPIAYLAAAQTPKPSESARILVRSTRPASDVIASLERAITAVSPDIVVSFDMLGTRIRESLRRERLMATLSGAFGGLATLLATIGLYGVLSYTVARRRTEIGIRLALGASRRDVMTMIVREAGSVVGVGLIAGGVLAIAASRAARTLLFGVGPGDPASLLMAAACFAIVGVVASVLPAARASRLEPSVTIREE